MENDTSIGAVFATSALLPYYNNTFALSCFILTTIIGVVGIAGVSLLLKVLLKELTASSSLLMLTLCMSDLLMQVSNTYFFFAVVSTNGRNRNLCIWNGICIILSAGGIYISLILIAVERYLYLCHGYKLSIQQSLICLFLFGIAAVCMTILILLFADTSLQLVPSRAHCIMAFSSRQPVPVILSVLSILLIIITSSTLIFCYLSIFFKYYSRKKSLSTSEEVLSKRSWIAKISSPEIIVFKKCMALSLSFLILWGSELVCILIEFGRGRNLPPAYSSILRILILTQTALDPILITYFDTKIRREILDLLGFGRTRGNLGFVKTDRVNHRGMNQQNPVQVGHNIISGTVKLERDT